MAPTLPLEICSAICDELEESTGTLALLCRTSRNFCYLAQRFLYRVVDLRGRDMRAMKSWARAVTRHTHLAERVHALALQLPEIQTLDILDTTKIGRALHRCVNLKELRLSAASDSLAHHGWIMDNYPFRLQKFQGRMGLGDSTYFWKTQTQIRVLSLPRLGILPSFENQLLDVIALGTPYLNDLPARPLQRIETGFHEDFSPLAQYSQTLTTLNIRGKCFYGEFSVPRTLAAIADSLPALLHLGMTELEKESACLYEVAPTSILQERFRKLETFILQVRNIRGFVVEGHFSHYDMALADDMEAFGVVIMNACPTLLRCAIHCVPTLGRHTSVLVQRHVAMCGDLRLRPATCIYPVICTASTRRLSASTCIYNVDASRHTSVNPRNALGTAMQYRVCELFNAVSTLV
ncbi:hypothetical protein K438DRAFT_999046 [Mycena galopus ATCC 62051]|nr:hypothetical protein K438DRAFT_999046 [Mycena galopus ATCC 62051]